MGEHVKGFFSYHSLARGFGIVGLTRTRGHVDVSNLAWVLPFAREAKVWSR